MLRLASLLSLVLLLAAPLSVTPVAVTPVAATPAAAVSEDVTAFVDVTVLDFAAQTPAAGRQGGQTVLVRGPRIVAAGPAAQIEIPESARRIDGRGKFLMPGLADMHVHFQDTDSLSLFLANGITTVRNLFGLPLHLRLRTEIERGEVLGPRIYTAGPILDVLPPVWPNSEIVGSAEDVERAVRAHHAAGYDFIKLYPRFTAEMYQAAIKTAKEVGISVIGHNQYGLPFDEVLMHQQSLEHLDGYSRALLPDTEQLGGLDFGSRQRAWVDMDPEKLAAIVETTVEAGIWNCPTLTVLHEVRATEDEADARLQRPEMRYLPPTLLEWWKGTAVVPAEQAQAYRAGHPSRLRLVRALYDAGAPLLVGTDTPNPFVVPGFSIHQELAYFVDAGLTPLETLRIATLGAADYLDAEQEFGRVAVGLAADLLLLEADPLTDVGNLREPAGVMVHGTWLPSTELERMLQAVASKYAKTPVAVGSPGS